MTKVVITVGKYESISRAVDRAVTHGDIGHAEKLRVQIKNDLSNVRYALLDERLAYVLNTQPIKAQPENQARPPGPMTLSEAKTIVRLQKDYVRRHRVLVASSTKAHKKHARIEHNRRQFAHAISNIGPAHLSLSEKVESAMQLVEIQATGSLSSDGSLVMSPRFQGGRKLPGGLPGSKR